MPPHRFGAAIPESVPSMVHCKNSRSRSCIRTQCDERKEHRLCLAHWRRAGARRTRSIVRPGRTIDSLIHAGIDRRPANPLALRPIDRIRTAPTVRTRRTLKVARDLFLTRSYCPIARSFPNWQANFPPANPPPGKTHPHWRSPSRTPSPGLEPRATCRWARSAGRIAQTPSALVHRRDPPVHRTAAPRSPPEWLPPDSSAVAHCASPRQTATRQPRQSTYKPPPRRPRQGRQHCQQALSAEGFDDQAIILASHDCLLRIELKLPGNTNGLISPVAKQPDMTFSGHGNLTKKTYAAIRQQSKQERILRRLRQPIAVGGPPHRWSDRCCPPERDATPRQSRDWCPQQRLMHCSSAPATGPLPFLKPINSLKHKEF